MLAFRKFDTPNMKACYSAEWLFYLDGRWMMEDGYICRNGKDAWDWWFKGRKVGVSPNESPGLP